MQPQRLDKLIAAQGGFSRTQVKELIRAGLVIVDGARAVSPEQKLVGNEKVLVKGKSLLLREHLYIMMNKPAGVLSATMDRKQKTALDLLPPELLRPGLFPAGRLDKDTEGFLLITDDGDFAHKLLSPKNHVPKTYFVHVDKDIDASLAGEFAKGVLLDKGDITSPAELFANGAEAELTIYEGMYHQVKRMFARYGYNVVYLRRIRIGRLPLDPDLQLGCCREILHNEVQFIW